MSGSWYAIGMKISVIGTGYVGLVAGAGFADMGNDVTCCDLDAQKIEGLKRGVMPIYEPGLDKLVTHNAAEGRLTFTTDVKAGVAGAEVVLLAVGTPPGPDGSADLSYILKAAADVGDALTGWAVVVTKSTVPVGTGDKIEAIISKRTKHEFAVASNPEFLKEGDALNDFMKPDRVVVGTDDKRAIETLRALYAPFTRTTDRMLVMDRRSAELTKYAANSMLATRISFMNDLANLCEILGADIELVRKGMGSDNRIGPKFLFAGPGFGGSCFPKDLRAAISTGREVGYKLEVLDAVVAVNERQKRRLGDKVLAHFGGDLKGKQIAVWGLAFKPGTDDIREAPALVLIEQLLAAGAKVSASDPVAIEAVRKQLGDRIATRRPLRLREGRRRAGAGHRVARVPAPVVRAPEVAAPPAGHLRRPQRLEPGRAARAGFTYYGMGRGVEPTQLETALTQSPGPHRPNPGRCDLRDASRAIDGQSPLRAARTSRLERRSGGRTRLSAARSLPRCHCRLRAAKLERARRHWREIRREAVAARVAEVRRDSRRRGQPTPGDSARFERARRGAARTRREAAASAAPAPRHRGVAPSRGRRRRRDRLEHRTAGWRRASIRSGRRRW